jgi:hypothetical protein
MLPGPTYIKECPYCKGNFTQPSMASGNTFGAKFWPDGKMEAPMMPSYPAYIGCPHCSESFWVEDAKEVGSISWGEEIEITDSGFKPAKNKKHTRYKEPTEKIYLQGLAVSNINKEREIYLRTKLMQLYNDANRDQKLQRPPTDEQIANWNRLLEILGSIDTQEKLLKVEIYREMGNFVEAKKAFTGKFDEDYIDSMERLDKLIEAKDSRVMCFDANHD